MNRHSPGFRSSLLAFFAVRALRSRQAATVGREKRRLRSRAVSVLAAVTLGLGAIVPASLTLDASPASAASCGSSTAPCAPTGVTFEQPGSDINTQLLGGTVPVPLSNVTVCGIEGEYAPLASAEIDTNYDDPERINAGNGTGTTEGNYPDSQVVSFKPATSLQHGDTITVTLPHPAEPYANSGSVLPSAQVPTLEPVEQASSTVSGQGTAPLGADITITVSLTAGSAALGGRTVRLNAFNPYDPPRLGNAPGQNVQGDTHASILGLTSTGNTGNNTATTDGNGIAKFQVTDSTNEDVVFAATDEANNLGILRTATVSFGTGGNGSATQLCSGSQLSAPPAGASDGFPYLLIENVGSFNPVGYLVPSVAVSSASGIETATWTVPGDVPATTGQVFLVALDAASPPGEGTPANPLSVPDTPYAPDAFSVSTSEDPVPGYPSAAPVFQADASSSLPNYPVDGPTSTLTCTSVPCSAQVGTSSNLTATATLRDFYSNPVNGKQVSVFQSSATHANVTPSTPPTAPDQYPRTGNDGTVAYGVSDSCAETVNLEATDVDDNQPVTSPSGSGQLFELPVTFTAGPPVAPDGTRTPVACGVPTVKSSVTASVNGSTPASGVQVVAPADGQTTATVQVTLGDQFGNTDACQQVILAATTRTSHATITPQPPANPAAPSATCTSPNAPGYTGSDGVATFLVSDSTAEQLVFDVADGTSPAVWPTNPATNPEDVAQINFEGADAGQSTVTASPSSPSCTQTYQTDACAPADGQSAATVTVTLNDAAGQAMQNKNVTLAGCSNDPDATSPPSCTADPTTTIAPSSVAADSHGQATFDIAGNSPNHTVYYQATDVSDGVTITQVVSIRFTPGGVSLSASPASVVADGTGISTVTFTLTDPSGNPVPGVAVSLAATPSTGATISPGSATTDSSGTTTFTVSDTQAGSVSVTATGSYTPSAGAACLGMPGSGGSCTVTASVKVNFIRKPNTFSITASPATGVPDDGLSSSQVTVTALDANGNPIAGIPVSLTAAGQSGGSPTVTPAGPVTNGNGQATFQVTDTTAENVMLSARYQEIPAPPAQPSGPSYPATDCPTGACTATVMFVPTEAQASTVTASPTSAPADGSSAVTVTVTLQSGSSAAPINGHSVVLVTGSATTTVVPSNVGGVTGLSVPGQVSFTITDTRPETLTVYARDENTGVILNEMPSITFTKTEVQLSTVTASPVTLPAGGPPGAPSTSTVTVTLSGPSCTTSLAGHTVTLTADSGSASIAPIPVPGSTSPPGVTDSGGVAEFAVSDPVVDTVTLTAADTTCGLTLAQTATVYFIASEANRSTVTISPVSTPADGPSATLTVTLTNPDGTPISGHTVTVPAVAHATVTPLAYPGLAPGVTNASGQAQFAVSDNTVEIVTLVAYDGTTELDEPATVSFTADEANQSTMSATATSLPALGAITTVTVTLISGGGAPIAGHNVSLSASALTVSIAPATATTNSAGQAQFTVSDPDAESVVLTALDLTTGVVMVQTLPLTFTANEQNQSTATASPTVVKVRKSSTITVTLLGASDQPLAGHTVALNTGSTTTKVTVLTPGGVTTATGQIQLSVTDTAAETLSIMVTDTTAGVTLYLPVTVTFTKS